MKQPCVYIMSNSETNVIYTGVTSNLVKRVYEHKQNLTGGFTSKYKCKMLLYFEMHDNMERAILREKQIKAGSRVKKLKLIGEMNPHFRDLYNDII